VREALKVEKREDRKRLERLLGLTPGELGHAG
jgi:hypothetical protein